MGQYIDVGRVRDDFVSGVYHELRDDVYAASGIVELFDSMPTAEATLVIHAKWETDASRPDRLICTHCDKSIDSIDAWQSEHGTPYCPYCGARMDADPKNWMRIQEADFE